MLPLPSIYTSYGNGFYIGLFIVQALFWVGASPTLVPPLTHMHMKKVKITSTKDFIGQVSCMTNLW